MSLFIYNLSLYSYKINILTFRQSNILFFLRFFSLRELRRIINDNTSAIVFVYLKYCVFTIISLLCQAHSFNPSLRLWCSSHSTSWQTESDPISLRWKCHFPVTRWAVSSKHSYRKRSEVYVYSIYYIYYINSQPQKHTLKEKLRQLVLFILRISNGKTKRNIER